MPLGRIVRAMLGLGLAWMMAACTPYSETPLSDPQQATVDTALIGSWQGGDPGDRIYVHIGAADTHRVTILTVEHTRSGQLKTLEYLAHSSQAGDHSYLNLVEQTAEASARGYVLIRYRVDEKGNLRIALPNLTGIKMAIRSGALAGRVEEGEFGDAYITASAADTAAYLNDHQAELFEKEVALNRLD